MIEKVCCIIILFAGEVAIATIINLYKDALSKMEEIRISFEEDRQRAFYEGNFEEYEEYLISNRGKCDDENL